MDRDRPRKLILSAIFSMAAFSGISQPDESAVNAASVEWRERHGARIIREFVDLLSIPNVASDRANIRKNAETIAALFRQRGAEMTLLELEDAPPIVFGKLRANGAKRTIGIYIHYDGQPADPAEWTQPPWSPTLYTAAIEEGGLPRALPEDGEKVDPEWRIYARSSGDDKAPIPSFLQALDALEANDIEITSNLVFFFDGEEEVGSPNLGSYLDGYRDLIGDVDGWLVFDGPVHQSRRPQLVFGVRGYTGMELTVYGPARELHSGHYGNWAPNPAMMLAQLLASMKDEDGNVLVDGFGRSSSPIGAAEREALAAVPDPDETLMWELGLARTEGHGVLKERLLLPSLNVRGIKSANVGELARNVIPSSATASIDIRLVKGNDPEKMLDLVERHISSRGYTIVREEPPLEFRRKHPRIARIDRKPGYVAARTEMSGELASSLIAAAELAAGESVILVPSLGGSLPLYLFTERYEVPLVVVPIANHDNNQHAPDENLRIANLWYGIDLVAAILTME